MTLPQLTTQNTRLLELEKQILQAQPAVEHWLRSQWLEHAAPFYASVDLRNSGFKLAPVDTNLFPGGFNNLNPEFLPLCVQAAMTALEKVCPDARGALLIPENHTRNAFYLQNVAVLRNILRRAGMRVRIGTLIPELCTQFVGFTINTERPGFVQALEQAADDVLFLTLFRRTDGTKRLEQDLPAQGVIQTDNGMLVKDRDYFMRFDVTNERTV